MERIISQEEVAYLAGFIDGEGSISIARNKPKKRYRQGTVQHCISIQISNCNYQVLDYLHSVFGGILCSRGKTTSGKRVFGLSFSTDRAHEILNLIRPYLIAKKEVASLAIEFHQHRISRKGAKPSLEEMDKREWYKKKIMEINAID